MFNVIFAITVLIAALAYRFGFMSEHNTAGPTEEQLAECKYTGWSVALDGCNDYLLERQSASMHACMEMRNKSYASGSGLSGFCL